MADLPPKSNTSPGRDVTPAPAPSPQQSDGQSRVGRHSSRGIRGGSVINSFRGKPPKPTVDWTCCSAEDLLAIGLKPNMTMSEIGRIFDEYFNIRNILKDKDDSAAGPSSGDGDGDGGAPRDG